MLKNFIDFEDWEMLIIETNMKNMIDIFKESVKKRYVLSDFSLHFLTSDTFNNYFSDQTLNSQSYKYVLQSFEKEMIKKNIYIPKNIGMNLDDLITAKSIGETFSWWKQADDEYPTENIKNINFVWLCKYASSIFKQDCSDAIYIIKDSLEINEKINEYDDR